MNKVFLADTMALVLYLEKRKMPEFSKRVFQDRLSGNAEMLVSPISLAEAGYLSERGRIDASIENVLSLIDNNKGIALTPNGWENSCTCFSDNGHS